MLCPNNFFGDVYAVVEWPCSSDGNVVRYTTFSPGPLAESRGALLRGPCCMRVRESSKKGHLRHMLIVDCGQGYLYDGCSGGMFWSAVLVMLFLLCCSGRFAVVRTCRCAALVVLCCLFCSNEVVSTSGWNMSNHDFAESAYYLVCRLAPNGLSRGVVFVCALSRKCALRAAARVSFFFLYITQLRVQLVVRKKAHQSHL